MASCDRRTLRVLFAAWSVGAAMGCGRLGFDPRSLGELKRHDSLDVNTADSSASGSGGAPGAGGGASTVRRDAATSTTGGGPDAGAPDGKAPLRDGAAGAPSRPLDGASGSHPPPGDAASDAGGNATGPGDPLAPLDDDFTGAVLGPNWSMLPGARETATVSGGNLVLVPTEVGQWFLGDHAGGVVTSVTGDFVATAQISVVSNAGGGGPLVGPGLELGGLIARKIAPLTDPENHVWVAVGASDAAPSHESKSTLDSMSTYFIDPYPETRAIVRLCRIGSTFMTYHQPWSGGAWSPHHTFDRPDLPPTLGVGTFASEQAVPLDIHVNVGWITFRRPKNATDCTAP